MPQPVLGILTLYLDNKGRLEERGVYKRMIESGRRLGLDIFVFTPDDVSSKKDMVLGHFWDEDAGRWNRKWTPIPTMIFDRCRIQQSPRFERLKRFRAKYGGKLFLNRPMRHKWTVYRTLVKDSRFRPHLPVTRMYESSADLTEMIKRYSLLYLKPISGTGGRGILRIQRDPDGSLLIQGRDRSRKIIAPQRVSPSALTSKLASWNLKGNRYLVQQGIQLKLQNGRVHDYRMLVQKNGSGVWDVTGCAGRIGPRGSVTSNLHGGGRAARMEELLAMFVDNTSSIPRIRQEAEQFGLAVARYLEQSYGGLCELALDLAIDRKGHIWLLEVNPKPAREVFAQAGEKETYRNAIIRPLEYAAWLYQNQSSQAEGKTASRRKKSRTSRRVQELASYAPRKGR